jgi:threonine-phosphate decarboxylase
MTVHGGDAHAVAEKAGIAVSEILDFSANVNPRGLPERARERLLADASNQQLLGLYPEPSSRRLRCALSKQLGVSPDAIVVGPGAEALFTPILRCLRPARALVPVPAFSEYRRVCAREDIKFTPFPLSRDNCFRLPLDHFRRRIETRNFDVVMLNNPHNPSGCTVDRDEIRCLLETVTAQGGTLLLDEAFIDYVPGASLASDAAVEHGLIVVRSLTNFYGCPALRVGYAVTLPETA